MRSNFSSSNFETDVVFEDFADLCLEAVTTSRNRLDINGRLLGVSEGLPKHSDVESYITFLNENVRPKRSEHFFLGDNRTLISHQEQKCFEHFWSHRHHAPIAEKDALVYVYDKRIELINVSESQGHKLSLFSSKSLRIF